MNKLLRQVLLIEDNIGDVNLLRNMFRDQIPNNTVVTHLDCMRAAEEYLSMQTTDIILLDLGLPDAQGIDAVRRVHATAPHVPLVVLTGSDDESMALQALKQGAQEYLIKGELEARGLHRALRYAIERKIMEDALFTEMERAQVTLTSIGDAVVCTDNAGQITFVNLAAETLTGWPWHAAVGRHVTEILRLVDISSRCSLPDPILTAIGENRTVRRQSNSILIQQNGAEVTIEECVSPIHDREGNTSGAVIVLRDVTEGIKAQREIVESKRIFEDLFNNSDAAIVDRDFSKVFRSVQELKAKGVHDLRGYFAELKERLSQLIDELGTNGANASALRMFRVSSPNDIPKQPAILVDIAEAMLHGIENIRRSDYLTRNGLPIPVIYTFRVPKTEEEARRVPIIIIDLSNVRLAEAARQASVAKSQFLSSMSHEIRTPLNGVIGNLELLALTALDGEQLELVDDADKAAKALLGLVGNILDFSKIEAGKLAVEMDDINLPTLVEEAADVLQSRARQKNIFITTTFGSDVPSLVRGDAARVRQILLNLIGNAVKFTAKGGVNVDLNVASWNGEKCTLLFNVYDSGSGFDEIQKQRLFEPFVQEHSPVDGLEGTGLGLSICKSLVELFGGTIGCMAELGEGATFYFTLPVTVVRRTALPVRPTLSGIRAVIIGQNDGIANSLADYFKSRGGEVVARPEHSAGAFALIEAARKSSSIDVAVFVPGHGDDCPDMAYQLRLEQIVPLVYGSGSSVRLRLRQGFTAIIPPDTSAEFLDRNIRQLLGHANTRNHVTSEQAAFEAAISADIRGKRVLVLEDRLVNQIVIQKQLSKLGIECVLAGDGAKGLEILADQRFDLILCDCSMPVMNGYHFTQALRKREVSKNERRVPVIALTANAFREDLDRCLASGMDDFMSKPVTMDRLSAMLLRWLSPNVGARSDAEQLHSDGLRSAIDMGALTDVLGTDEPDTVSQVLNAFLATAGSSLANVEAALLSGVSVQIRAAAHGAKGEARCAAATGLAELYAALEKGAEDADRTVSHGLAVRAAVELRGVEDFVRLRLGTLVS